MTFFVVLNFLFPPILAAAEVKALLTLPVTIVIIVVVVIMIMLYDHARIQYYMLCTGFGVMLVAHCVCIFK